MNVLAWAWSALQRLPTTSELLANFSTLSENDRSRANIERRLAWVLAQSLRRSVAVIPADILPESSEQKADADGPWIIDRRTIEACLERARVESTVLSGLEEVFGGARIMHQRIAALVPIFSSSGSRIATVAVGRRRFRPLTASERELIATALTTTTLLLEQVRLRDALSVAAQAEAVKRIEETHRQVAKRYLRIEERDLN
jgi:hypothetical protein